MQFLISSYDGRLLSLSFPATLNAVTLGMVKQAFEERAGVPADELRISCHGRCLLNDDQLFTPSETLSLPPLRVGLRVVGGKGGFGSLLRGGNTRVGQKKTTNFDACRDLNGRRLRHVNNEKRLAEWYALEKDRELAKLGEKHSRTVQKQHVFDETAYRQSLESIEQEVATSLQAGLEEARAARQQHQANPSPPPTEAAWDFAYPDDDDDEDGEEEEEGEEEVEEENADEEEEEKGEKESKGKEKAGDADEQDRKKNNKRERTDGEEDEERAADGNASSPLSKKAKREDASSSITTTAAACGKASALPTPPDWILG